MKKFLILNLFISYCTGQMTSMWIPTRQLACGCPTIKPGESYLVLDELENGGKSSTSNSRYVFNDNEYHESLSHIHVHCGPSISFWAIYIYSFWQNILFFAIHTYIKTITIVQRVNNDPHYTVIQQSSILSKKS